MKLINLEKKEFKEFALNHSQNNFYQTIEWGLLKEKNGWKMFLLGLTEANIIKAACMVLLKKTPLGNILYSPRGFLIDYNNLELLKTFTDEIIKFGKSNNAIFIKIDPYVSNKERDIDGNIVENGFNNEKSINNLINLGYKHTGFNLYFENLQPRWMFSLNLENKSLDDVLANMESKTRQLIRKNIKMNLTTRELSDTAIDEFKKIMTHTSERRGFIDRPFSYYKDMYNMLSKNNMIKFVVTELDSNNYLEILNEELKEEENGISEKEKRIEEKAQINVQKTLKQIELGKDNIVRINKKIEGINNLRNKYGKESIILGGILFITYGDEVLSLFGGSYEEFMEYSSPYTTNYEMIKYAKENGYKRYNFYGISGDFNLKNQYHGLYDFKRGFGGEVIELIGEFDLVINKPLMTLYKISIKLYSFLKGIKSKITRG